MAMMQEYYRPQPMGVNTSYEIRGVHMAGFLATVAGTLTVTSKDGTVLVNALPVTVGHNPIPLLFPTNEGGTVTLAGGAAGTLLV